MNADTFAEFCQLVYDKSGISLKPGKEALVAARVAKRLRALHLTTAEEYLSYLRNDTGGDEIVYLLDAISTNVTSFFREAHHFDILRKLMEGSVREGIRNFRIWSAASSTGEEPYTIAMLMAEICAHPGIEWKILATDISTKVLALAEQGLYAEAKLSTVPPALRQKYFDPVKDASGQKYYRVKPVLKERVLYKRLNLSQTPFPMKGPMDFIFCRNVMIYFDNQIRQPLVAEFSRLLKHGGLLFLGSSESLTGLKTDLSSFGPSVYLKT